MNSMETTEVRVLSLNSQEILEGKLFRLQKGWLLRFALGPSLQGETVRIFSNHPLDADIPYKRSKYYEIPLESPTGRKNDTYDCYAELCIRLAGSFHYYFTLDNSDKKTVANGSGYFLVDPTLTFGRDGDVLPLDCIQCQTVLSKCLGSLYHWEGRLRVAKETGYNMIHFTPIQERGHSNSAYSLRDQHTLDPLFYDEGKKNTFEDVEVMVKYMRDEWKILSVTDLVYNHTSSDSPWLLTHPECAYNLKNSAHLKPAFVIDRILWHLTLAVADGKLEYRGVPPVITDDAELQHIKNFLLDSFLPRFKLYEFYTCDVDKILKDFKKAVEAGTTIHEAVSDSLVLIQDPEYRRLCTTVDMNTALSLYNIDQSGVKSRQDRIALCYSKLKDKLEKLNEVKKEQMWSHLCVAVDNLVANVQYRFLQKDGPRYEKVSRKTPLMSKYFTIPSHSTELSVEDDEAIMEDNADRIMAHNGWVMDQDPRENFAELGSNVYLRREVIIWGDSVKLRYGEQFEDCPFLWQHMLDYTNQVVKIFHGIRLDNCHSTPLHVAEFMMDAARKVRPDVYVIAELFTKEEHLDNIFINHLGINSLIREAMSAWDSHEQGRLVYRYGGVPVGAFMQPHVQPLVPSVAHAIFFDVTHDNPSIVEKRSIYDAISNSALVSMACCATGSNRGYDELVPHHIHVVNEARYYTYWNTDKLCGHLDVNNNNGIIAVKRALNGLHYELGMQGYTQVFVDQMDSNVVAVTRHNPTNHNTVVLVSHTAFQHPPHSHAPARVKPLSITGNIDEIILEARLEHHGLHSYHEHKEVINGLPDFRLKLRQNITLSQSEVAHVWEGQHIGEKNVQLTNLTPGSVIALRISLDDASKTAIKSIKTKLQQCSPHSTENNHEELWSVVSNLSLTDMNRILYRCDPEERDDGHGFGIYHVPNFKDMVYCGLQGVMSLLSKIRPANDLGHPLCSNLREGDWLAGYLSNRLKVDPGTEKLGEWLGEVTHHLGDVPRYLVPCYFDAIITGLYMVIMQHTWNLMSQFVRDGSSFVRSLAMGTVQMCNIVKTAKLPVLSPKLNTPLPPVDSSGQQACVTLAAGMPHFASGIMRNWGRDTFISIRGLMMLTHRFNEARFIILAFGGCLRHGLVPNLLGEGSHARYNCRDAIWWWLQSIQSYCSMAPEGVEILQDVVSRLFPSDDSSPQEPGDHDEPLCNVIQEAIQRHVDGVKYTERNAGPNLDRDMSDKGFDNEIGIDWETGFVYGGNEHNCGTWMDKMGSSDTAGNKGQPATPRDGSAVELVGLCKATIRWLGQLNKKGLYPYDGVNVSRDGSTKKITWEEWNSKILNNFEKLFWISAEPNPVNEPKPELIHTRGIYKDTYLSSQFWADYQLRPNYPIAMVVAPELFTPENAWVGLQSIQDVLLGPIGMKTLQPSDWAYHGFYVNSDQSSDPKVSHGFNYHNGPEWVWPVGYFLRAKLIFAKMLEASKPGILSETIKFVKQTLAKHNLAIEESDWRSLPELTNENGAHCPDSCPAQAWSMATILEVMYELESL